MTEKEIQEAIKDKIAVYYVDDDDEYFYEDIPVKEADIRKVYILPQKCIVDNNKTYVGKYDGIKTPNETTWVKPKSELFLTYDEAYQESLKRFREYVSDLRVRYEKIGNALLSCEKYLSNIIS